MAGRLSHEMFRACRLVVDTGIIYVPFNFYIPPESRGSKWKNLDAVPQVMFWPMGNFSSWINDVPWVGMAMLMQSSGMGQLVQSGIGDAESTLRIQTSINLIHWVKCDKKQWLCQQFLVFLRPSRDGMGPYESDIFHAWQHSISPPRHPIRSRQICNLARASLRLQNWRDQAEILEVMSFYRQLGCLAWYFGQKNKQLLNNRPSSDWSFSLKTTNFH